MPKLLRIPIIYYDLFLKNYINSKYFGDSYSFDVGEKDRLRACVQLRMTGDKPGERPYDSGEEVRQWISGLQRLHFQEQNHNHQQEFPFDAGEEVRQWMCLAAFSRALLTW
jgi:hypothetical protein